MEIKGITLKSRLDFLEHEYGQRALDEILPHLGEASRELFSGDRKIRATTWYDFDIQVELDRTICRHLADGDEAMYRRLGAFSAEFQENHSKLSESRDPWRFIEMNAVVFPRYFRPGHMEILRKGSTEALVRLHEFRSVRENCQTNLGFLKRGVELCGMVEVNAEETQCSEDPEVPYCEYRITWDTP